MSLLFQAFIYKIGQESKISSYKVILGTDVQKRMKMWRENDTLPKEMQGGRGYHWRILLTW